MKTIFIFSDSRLTDLSQRVTALGEDGQLVGTVVFDRTTSPHSEFAMGCVHELDPFVEPSIAVPVNSTRAATLAAYDRAYGRGNWMPMWLEQPALNSAWCAAMSIYRARAASRGPVFSDRALSRILADVLASDPESPPRVVH